MNRNDVLRAVASVLQQAVGDSDFMTEVDVVEFPSGDVASIRVRYFDVEHEDEVLTFHLDERGAL